MFDESISGIIFLLFNTDFRATQYTQIFLEEEWQGRLIDDVEGEAFFGTLGRRQGLGTERDRSSQEGGIDFSRR